MWSKLLSWSTFYQLLLVAGSKSLNRDSSELSSSRDVGTKQENFLDSLRTRRDIKSSFVCSENNPNTISLHLYKDLLQESRDFSCSKRQLIEPLLLREMPDVLLDAIEQHKEPLAAPCSYVPLSENMVVAHVNNDLELQQLRMEDGLRLRLNYWIHYYQTCLPNTYDKISTSLSEKEKAFIIPDCKSLEIIKRFLPQLYALIFDKYLVTNEISIPQLELDLRSLVKIASNKLTQEFGQNAIIQCHIDNIDYILRGRKGLRFLLHNFSIQAINKLLLPEIKLFLSSSRTIDISTTRQVDDNRSPLSACLETPLVSDVHTKLQNRLNDHTLKEPKSLRHCGDRDYELFKLGVVLEDKNDFNETLSCLLGNIEYSVVPSKIPLFIRKLVDNFRKEELLACTSSFISDVTSDSKRPKRSPSHKKTHPSKGAQLNKIKPCERHELVTTELNKTISHIIQENALKANNSSCSEIKKVTFEMASEAEFQANLNLVTSTEKCSLKPDRIKKPTHSTLMVAYTKVLRTWMVRDAASCVDSNQDYPSISFSFSTNDRFCFKLSLPLVEHNFKLMLKRPEVIGPLIKELPNFDSVLEEQNTKLNATFKDLLEEDSIQGSLARQHLAEKNPKLLKLIPLELVFYFAAVEDIISIEQFLTGQLITHSSSGTQRTCNNYLIGSMYFKKAENLYKSYLSAENDEIKPKTIIDYFQKAESFYKRHVNYIEKFGNPDEYLYQVNLYKKELLNNKEINKRHVSHDEPLKESEQRHSCLAHAPSKVCDIPLENYILHLSPKDTDGNRAFKASIFLALDCKEEGALKQLSAAFSEESDSERSDQKLMFKNNFKQCSEAKFFKTNLKLQIIKNMESSECKKPERRLAGLSSN